MHPIQMQEGDRGIGMGYTGLIDSFEAICQQHKGARAFAFVFYDMTNGVAISSHVDVAAARWRPRNHAAATGHFRALVRRPCQDFHRWANACFSEPIFVAYLLRAT
jgi:hypothetical protein